MVKSVFNIAYVFLGLASFGLLLPATSWAFVTLMITGTATTLSAWWSSTALVTGITVGIPAVFVSISGWWIMGWAWTKAKSVLIYTKIKSLGTTGITAVQKAFSMKFLKDHWLEIAAVSVIAIHIFQRNRGKILKFKKDANKKETASIDGAAIATIAGIAAGSMAAYANDEGVRGFFETMRKTSWLKGVVDAFISTVGIFTTTPADKNGIGFIYGGEEGGLEEGEESLTRVEEVTEDAEIRPFASTLDDIDETRTNINETKILDNITSFIGKHEGILSTLWKATVVSAESLIAFQAVSWFVNKYGTLTTSQQQKVRIIIFGMLIGLAYFVYVHQKDRLDAIKRKMSRVSIPVSVKDRRVQRRPVTRRETQESDPRRDFSLIEGRDDIWEEDDAYGDFRDELIDQYIDYLDEDRASGLTPQEAYKDASRRLNEYFDEKVTAYNRRVGREKFLRPGQRDDLLYSVTNETVCTNCNETNVVKGECLPGSQFICTTCAQVFTCVYDIAEHNDEAHFAKRVVSAQKISETKAVQKPKKPSLLDRIKSVSEQIKEHKVKPKTVRVPKEITDPVQKRMFVLRKLEIQLAELNSKTEKKMPDIEGSYVETEEDVETFESFISEYGDPEKIDQEDKPLIKKGKQEKKKKTPGKTQSNDNVVKADKPEAPVIGSVITQPYTEKAKTTFAILTEEGDVNWKGVTKVRNYFVSCRHGSNVAIGDTFKIGKFEYDKLVQIATGKCYRLGRGDAQDSKDWEDIMTIECPKEFNSAKSKTPKVLKENTIGVIQWRRFGNNALQQTSGQIRPDGTHSISTEEGASGSGLLDPTYSNCYGVHHGNVDGKNAWVPFTADSIARLFPN
jgi:hypothetical protein